MRNSLVTAAALLAAAALLWQFKGDDTPDETAVAGGEVATEMGREVGPSFARTAEQEARIVEPQPADRRIRGRASSMVAPGEVEGAPLSAADSPSPLPVPELLHPSHDSIIQAMIDDGAPDHLIESFERSFELAALSPEERREAEALEPAYEPPSPEEVEDLIWHAHLEGDIPFELVDELIEAHWKRVEEEERRALEQDEVLSRD